MLVKLEDFKITTLTDSVKRLKISDKEYFGPKYKNYVSNSRLKWINPEQGGSPEIYKNGLPQETTSSLSLGSAVHELFLQSEEFALAEGLHKPSAKLGQVIDFIKTHRANGKSIIDSINSASEDANYYVSSLTQKRIRNIIEKGLYYYIHSKGLDSSIIVLSDSETEACKRCLESLRSNRGIMSLVDPQDELAMAESYNEDALFLDVKVDYLDKSTILKLKMKADNWTIDTFNQELVLNDLKTTSKPVAFFMQEYGSFIHFHYARQMAMYSWMLKEYCKSEYGYDDDSWKFRSNMILVETNGEFQSRYYSVNEDNIKSGEEELFRLLKMVAYYEIHGYEDVVEFA